jgi:hypothetical protein
MSSLSEEADDCTDPILMGFQEERPLESGLYASRRQDDYSLA